jgi:hypothetical protein
MRHKDERVPDSVEKSKGHADFSAEDKIRIVLERLRRGQRRRAVP